MIARVNQSVTEDFSVLDLNNDLKPGIALIEFNALLYDPDGNASGITVTFAELGNGHYRATFTPDAIGQWFLVVTHATYFPWGKAGAIEVFENDFDTLGTDLELIKQVESGRWKIINNQMIFYGDDNLTELFRMNLYDSAGAPTMENVYERRRA